MKSPKCPACGSREIIYPGFCTFHWRNGRWVMDRHSPEMATANGAPMVCQNCGKPLICDDLDNPSKGIAVQDL